MRRKPRRNAAPVAKGASCARPVNRRVVGSSPTRGATNCLQSGWNVRRAPSRRPLCTPHGRGGFDNRDPKARCGDTVGVSSGVSRTAGENVRILPWPVAASASGILSSRRARSQTRDTINALPPSSERLFGTDRPHEQFPAQLCFVQSSGSWTPPPARRSRISANGNSFSFPNALVIRTDYGSGATLGGPATGTITGLFGHVPGVISSDAGQQVIVNGTVIAFDSIEGVQVPITEAGEVTTQHGQFQSGDAIVAAICGALS
jgi:hypothetical protein